MHGRSGFRLIAAAACLVGLCGGAALVLPLRAQTEVSVDGAVETTAGGLRYPDGSLQATALPRGAPVRRTGLSGCFDEDGDFRGCSGTGEDAEFMAGLSAPSPRFTSLGDGTAVDNLTGLIWLEDANCPAATLGWQAALDWIVSLNTTAVACDGYAPMTFTDWRLPNVEELSSLIDFGESAPALTFGHPFIDVQSSAYWSSSSDAAATTSAWEVDLTAGDALTGDKAGLNHVWAVRGGRL